MTRNFKSLFLRIGLVVALGWMTGCTTTVRESGVVEAELLGPDAVRYNGVTYSVSRFLGKLKSDRYEPGVMVKYRSATPPSDQVKKKVTSLTMQSLYYASFVSQKTVSSTVIVNTTLYGTTQLVYKSRRFTVAQLVQRLKQEKVPQDAMIIIHSAVEPSDTVQSQFRQALQEGGFTSAFRWKQSNAGK